MRPGNGWQLSGGQGRHPPLPHRGHEGDEPDDREQHGREPSAAMCFRGR
ncbi:hypothetical protein [Herbiconiux daphne]|uniref:Uncharacterized protein n=1 Tax=Herbiconiux daphne TaxID=2970914 RepID=A0ABT2H1D0_9MICO|nr:hypothetical protein [Herbiconiux daphne]MCS5733715.1 hypothetical protein [Herbiconiux daphne]